MRHIDIMRLARFLFLAVPLCTFAAAAGCSAPSDDASISADESNYTSEAGADAGSGEASSIDATSAAAEVPAFTVADATGTPKLRFSVDGAAPVEAYEPKWTTDLSGDRRFKIEGATPIAGGKPYFYVEFGRGAAFIERGTYDCASLQAIALIVDADGVKKMSVVNGGTPRACQVVIDAAEDMDVSSLPSTTRPPSMRKVAGRIEAIVGERTNAAAETKTVRAAFATIVTEMRQL